MNTEDFVTYEQALALKELGFKEECFHHYYNKTNKLEPNKVDAEDAILVDFLMDFNYDDEYNCYISAPTLWQAQKWFIQNKNIYIYQKVEYNRCYKIPLIYVYVLNLKNGTEYRVEQYYLSNEEALSAGITECLKLLKSNIGVLNTN